MAYRTILVEVADDSALEPRLEAARALAGRFDAVLIGMHAMPSPFIPVAYGDASAYLGPELIEAQREATGMMGLDREAAVAQHDLDVLLVEARAIPPRS